MKTKSSKKHEKEKKYPNREEQVKKYQNIAPSQIFYNPNSIKWFNKKYKVSLIKKSIYSLFPNNCLPALEEKDKTARQILREFVDNNYEIKDKNSKDSNYKEYNRYEDVWINPKYFFSKEVYESILKLKEIFLQFDEDGSRKMEIDEMTTMFNTNNINVTEEELCELFFKGKKYKKEDINSIYLDFFQFMNFALSKKSDQEFRVFMRKIKEKKMKEKELERIAEEEKRKKNMEITEEEEPVDDLYVDEKKEPVFFPMNFNLLLDYFINKGKERKSQKKIRRAIKMMRNILTPGRYPETDPDFQDDDEGEEEDAKSKENKKNEEKTEEKKEDEYDKQLREINTMEIMEEFDKLFKMNYISPSSSLKEQTKTKVITSKVAEDTKKNNSYSRSFFRQNTFKPFQKINKLEISEKDSNNKTDVKKISKKEINITNMNQNQNKEKGVDDVKLNSNEIKRFDRRMNTYKSPLEMNELKNNLIGNKEDKNNKKDENINKSEKKRCMFFSDLIKKELEEPNIENMNIYYFNKLHSVSLAKKATEKKIIDYFSKQKDKKIELKTNSKNGKNILPVIKNKSKIKIDNSDDKENKKSVSVRKSEYNRLLDSFGFRRKKYKTQFLY